MALPFFVLLLLVQVVLELGSRPVKRSLPPRKASLGPETEHTRLDNNVYWVHVQATLADGSSTSVVILKQDALTKACFPVVECSGRQNAV